MLASGCPSGVVRGHVLTGGSCQRGLSLTGYLLTSGCPSGFVRMHSGTARSCQRGLSSTDSSLHSLASVVWA